MTLRTMAYASLYRYVCVLIAVMSVSFIPMMFVDATSSVVGSKLSYCDDQPDVYAHDYGRFPPIPEDVLVSKVRVSKPAPQWEGTAIVNGEIVNLKSSDFDGSYTVIVFFPLAFTFVCPTEIIAFSDAVKEFDKLNTKVIAVSVDSQFTLLAWMKSPRSQGGLGTVQIPLMSDLSRRMSADYGVLLEEGMATRGLFIIDNKGILRQVTINDLPVGRSVDETLRLVQAFQYVDQHGEVCPANWTPGSDTIKPNPVDKLKYFSKHDS